MFIVVLGLGLFSIFKFLGGAKESQNAADSGSLNVAREVAKNVGVPLSAGIELDNFSPLVDKDTGKINLLSYNRLVGQVLMVALNAQDEGTALAQQRARQLLESVQSGSSSLSARLHRELSRQDGPAAGYFNQMAGRNSLRMLDGGAALAYNKNGYKVAYLSRYSASNPDGATNVSINPADLPTGMKGILTDVEDKNNPGCRFIKGYSALNLPDVGTLYGVTTNPGQGAHLVSVKSFEAENESPVPSGFVPPNCFQAVAKTGGERGLLNVAIAEIGSLTKTFKAGIPGGYIRVRNEGGIDWFGTNNASVENPLNNELVEGIYLTAVANGSPSSAAGPIFAMDKNLLNDWITYNQSLEAAGTHPWEMTDWPEVNGRALSGEGIFNAQGNPVSRQELGSILSWYGNAGNSEAQAPHKYDYLDLDPRANHPELVQLYQSGAILKAYTNNPNASLGRDSLLAAEFAKAQLIESYFSSWSHDGGPRTINASKIMRTGLRIFDRGLIYITIPQGIPTNPLPAQSMLSEGTIKFSRPGTVNQYLDKVDEGKGAAGSTAKATIKNLLFKRLRQVSPGLTMAKLNKALNKIALDLGETAFIYAGQDGELTMTKAPPPGARQNVPPPDGAPQIFSSQKYSLINRVVNPPHELNIHHKLFAASTGRIYGQDQVQFTPNSGFGNSLGDLVFYNRVEGTATFSAPN
jgi:hypothetical protein